MKNVVFTYLLVAGMVLISFVGTANAVVSDIDLGKLYTGQSGVIKNQKASGGVAISKIEALLPSHSAVTFSYSFKGDLQSGLLASGGQYSYYEGGLLKTIAPAGDLHQGFTAALSNSPLSFAISTVNGTPLKTALAYASADLDVKGNTATATIVNKSGGVLSLTSALAAFVGKNKKYSISYNVTEAPLPAALPMFALGLCAVAGVRRRKKEIA